MRSGANRSPHVLPQGIAEAAVRDDRVVVRRDVAQLRPQRLHVRVHGAVECGRGVVPRERTRFGGTLDAPTAAVAPLDFDRGTSCALDGMLLADYPGPKAQIFYAGQNTPDYFCDTVEMFHIYLTPEQIKPWYDLVKDPIHNKWIKDCEAKKLPAQKVYTRALELTK